MASSSSCTTLNYLEDFLLNSGPKQDCLVRICKYINAYDMVNLSESSKHTELFVEFFKDRVIDMNSFDLVEFQSEPDEAETFQKVFVHFGSCMQKLKVALSSVSLKILMQNIIQYCVPGSLIELEIEILVDDFFENVVESGTQDLDHGLMTIRMRPILSRLEKLSLTKDGFLLESIFRIFRRDLRNLKSLKLKKFKFRDGWTIVFPNRLSNVTEIYLTKVDLTESVDGFELFLYQFINLQVFVHLRNNSDKLQPEVIADCLYRRFPQLRGIGCNVDDKRHQSTFTMGNRFDFLKKFTNLMEIHVACYDDYAPRDIHSIIQFVPNMKIFSVVETDLFHPPVTIRQITHSIKEIVDRRRNCFPCNDRVTVIVNKGQYSEFMVLRNINEFIQLSTMISTNKRSRTHVREQSIFLPTYQAFAERVLFGE